MGFGQRENLPVHLTPPHRPRAALGYEAEHLAEYLITLLMRESGNAKYRKVDIQYERIKVIQVPFLRKKIRDRSPYERRTPRGREA
jgi:hypothetical protein